MKQYLFHLSISISLLLLHLFERYSENGCGSTAKGSRGLLGVFAVAVTAAAFVILAVLTQGAENYAS